MIYILLSPHVKLMYKYSKQYNKKDQLQINDLMFPIHKNVAYLLHKYPIAFNLLAESDIKMDISGLCYLGFF